MAERPWLILTLRRTGGTSLTAFLTRISGFATLEHEPFNRDRQLGAITRDFVASDDREALRRDIAAALQDRPNIKHCIEVVHFAITEELIDACTARDYRILVLTRRDEARRLLSLALAQATGAWGPEQAQKVYPAIRQGTIRPRPIDLDRLRHRADEDRRLLARLHRDLARRDIAHRQAWFEDLYRGTTPLTEQGRALAHWLGIPLDPDAPDLRHLASGRGQGSDDIAGFVPGYAEAVALAQELCQTPPRP